MAHNGSISFLRILEHWALQTQAWGQHKQDVQNISRPTFLFFNTEVVIPLTHTALHQNDALLELCWPSHIFLWINHQLLTTVISILCTLHIFESEKCTVRIKNGKWYVKTAIHSNQLLQVKNECLVCTKRRAKQKIWTKNKLPHTWATWNRSSLVR